MHQEQTIQRREEKYVNTHMRPANWQFGNREHRHLHWVAWVAFWADMLFTLELAVRVGQVEVHLIICASTVSADSFQCRLDKEGLLPGGCDEALPCVFPFQASASHLQETQLPTSSLFGLQHEISWWDIAFPLLWCTKTLLWPVWPYSMPGACWTVPAVPNLLALP